MVAFKSLKVGKKVKVQTWEGTVRIGVIDSVSKDIKNGRPGIDYKDQSGEYYWCYLYQIIEVVK